jgi:hypothetical protein
MTAAWKSSANGYVNALVLQPDEKLLISSIDASGVR